MEAVDRTLDHQRDYEVLTDVLLDQNRKWGASSSILERIESLRTGETVVVVTGQQLGIVGGPLYTQYKILTTIQLARHLEETTGRTVLPVFWLAGEDHDFEEVSEVLVTPDSSVSVTRDEAGPVGPTLLSDSIDDVLDEIKSACSGGDGSNELDQALKKFWKPGVRWVDAFAAYTRWLFRDYDLVLISVDDDRLKRLTQPLVRQALQDFDSLNDRIEDTSKVLAEKFHAQLTPRSTNLFLMDEVGRLPIEPEAGGFRAGDRQFSRDEMLEVVETAPGQFSPNVVLRPMVQDHLLPSVAYVAGPGEISYFAQLKSAYEWAKIPMPVIYPRASLTLVESNISRLLGKEGITFEQIDTDIERMFTSLVKDSMDDEIEKLFSSTRRDLGDAINNLADGVSRVDPTLKKSAGSIESALQKELGKLHSKVVRAEKQKQEVLMSRIEKIVDNLYPGSGLQERKIAMLYFLARYGTDFVSQIDRRVGIDTSRHFVVNL